MKFGIVVFPGSNCDDDMVYAFSQTLKQQAVKLWHKDHDLQGCDMVILPGGFSYGDYLRSGAIARFSPIMSKVIEHAKAGGFVLGVCNGFQILTEAGLLEGALLKNNTHRYICKNIYLKAVTNNSLVTKGLDPQRAYKIPIGHGEGRYYAPTETLRKLYDNDQILFKYTNANAEVTAEANPNGALDNIAGICNESRNVFGMMPHPERAADNVMGNTDGKAILDSIVHFMPTLQTL